MPKKLDRRVPHRDVAQTRGTMRQRSKAARFSRIVSSVPAPPATYANASADIDVLRALLESLDRDRDPRADAAGAADVDLELALAADPDRWPALGGHGGTLELGRRRGKAL